MSRIVKTRPQNSNSKEGFFSKWLAAYSGTEPHSRSADTYLAPESQTDGDHLNEASDVWSLGCVLSVVFTFIECGQQGVEEYGDNRLRTKNAGNRDTFYLHPPGSGNFTIHPAVNDWHNQLVKWAKEDKDRDPREAEILNTMLKYLQSKALNIEAKRRCTAEEVRKQLQIALGQY